MSGQPISNKKPATTTPSEDSLKFSVVMVTAGAISIMAATAFAAFIWKVYFPDDNLIELPNLLGVYGDFLSGFLGPLLSLVGIYFVVVTLREQRQTTLDERKAEKLEGFENRFYRLIDLHRANVTEMEVRSHIGSAEPITGKKIFLFVLQELQSAIIVTRKWNQESKLDLSTVQELQVAYYCVYFGIGYDSLGPLILALILTGTNISLNLVLDLQHALAAERRDDDAFFRFDGHQVRLGHYYRHLFQAVAYVEAQDLIEDKRSYVKTLRAQLSTHEQVLLLANSLTPVGWIWWERQFIKKYGMVRNIPSGMIERYVGLDVSDLLEDAYWEYSHTNQAPQEFANINSVPIIKTPQDFKKF